MWRCANCKESIEEDFNVCWNCQTGRDGSPPVIAVVSEADAVTRSKQRAESAVAAESPEVQSLMRRYVDAYTVARTISGLGKWVKRLGVGSGILFVVVGIGLIASGDPQGILVGAIMVGFGVIGTLWLFVLGILVAAQGQILLSSLDCAVNGSPFLSDRHRSKIMTL